MNWKRRLRARRGGAAVELLDEIGSSLSKQSLSEWPSCPEKTCEGDEVLMNNLYSIFTFVPLQNLYLGVSRLSKTFLIQYLSSDEIHTPQVVRLKSKKGWAR